MTTTTETDLATAEQFSGRLFNGAIEALDLLNVYIGDRLGLYRVLAEGGALTPGELAKRAKIHPRYAREWLEQQAVSGILAVDDAAKGEDERRYTLPPAHAMALTDLDSPFSMTPLARALVSCVQAAPKVLDAFRSGGGVDWADYGADGIESQGDFNRPWIISDLAGTYLPAVADVHARLQADPPARVADIACGVGWASIAIARAYPKVMVHGFDLDKSSIDIASGYAKEHGLADRVKFEARDAAELGVEGTYDLAIVIEAIHDLSRPVEVLSTIRRLLAPGGTAIIADERVGEKFTAPGDEVERLLYGVSVVLCLPAGMAEQPSAATGTVMRPDTLRRYAKEAGFKDVAILEDLEHPFLRFYRLTP